jgi:acylglycerol lipase
LEAYKLNYEDYSDVKEKEISFKGYGDVPLHLVSWIPKNMKVLLILIHGLGDHITRYRQWANMFNSKNIGIIGFDLRGHGESKGIRGDANYKNYLRDIDLLVRYTHKNYPFVPKLLYGHNLGGNIALKYTIDYKPKIAGIISTSPWIKPYRTSLILMGASRFLKKIMPFLTVSNKFDPNDLSHDKKAVESYRIDPFVHHKISPRLFLSILDAGRFILRNRHKINLPLLLMHGSSDRITSCKASINFTMFTSDNTTFRVWNGDYHELHNEFDKDEIFQYILRWIECLPSIQQH